VKKYEKFTIEVKFQPLAPYKLSGGEKNLLYLAISSGPTYTFQLTGSAKKVIYTIIIIISLESNCLS
jgi:hypothetical protein